MTLTLSKRIKKMIDEKVRSGQYTRPEDVVSAAIGSLIAQEEFGDFKIGELNKLLAAGERSIKRSGTMDGDEAIRRRRVIRAKTSAISSKSQ